MVDSGRDASPDQVLPEFGASGSQVSLSIFGEPPPEPEEFVVVVVREEAGALVRRISEVHEMMCQPPLLAIGRGAHGGWPQVAALRNQCLLAGADACVLLPDEAASLMAQAFALVRRACSTRKRLKAHVGSGLKFDEDALHVHIDGATTVLTPVEYRILRYLALREGVWIRPAELSVCTALPYFSPGASNLRWHVHQLRARLGAAARLVHGARSLGYMFSRSNCAHRHCNNLGVLAGEEERSLAVACDILRSGSAD